MADFISYITDRPLRWDTLALIAYGDPTMTEPLISANSASLPNRLIPSGSALIIPILTGPANVIPKDKKPPWA